MTSSDVLIADRIAKQHAVLFLVFATMLLINAWVTISAGIGSSARVLAWIATIALAVLNLTPAVAWFRPRALRTMLNDETARDNRRSALQVGFWAVMCSASLVAVAGTQIDVEALAATRVVVTAGLVAALVSLATLELRAARG